MMCAFNIDLLQMYRIIFTMTYLETAASIGFLPQITLPTRIGETGYRRSLKENIFFTNAIDAKEYTILGTLLPDTTDQEAFFPSVNNVQYKE